MRMLCGLALFLFLIMGGLFYVSDYDAKKSHTIDKVVSSSVFKTKNNEIIYLNKPILDKGYENTIFKRAGNNIFFQHDSFDVLQEVTIIKHICIQ